MLRPLGAVSGVLALRREAFPARALVVVDAAARSSHRPLSGPSLRPSFKRWFVSASLLSQGRGSVKLGVVCFEGAPRPRFGLHLNSSAFRSSSWLFFEVAPGLRVGSYQVGEAGYLFC